MKFEITRTSIDSYVGEDIPPCKEAVRESPWHWSIEVNSINELVTLCQKYGHLIVMEFADGYGIEIYDDYRE